MTGGDTNVNNIKMHSSQRNGRPTKRKKLTDQTAHSCPSQTDGTKKRTPDWFSVALHRFLDWYAPHSLSHTKAQIKKQAWQQHLWRRRGNRRGMKWKSTYNKRKKEGDQGEDDEGTHGWLNPSLERPSSRQGAHTFPSFALWKKGLWHAKGWGQKWEGWRLEANGKSAVQVKTTFCWARGPIKFG